MKLNFEPRKGKIKIEDAVFHWAEMDAIQQWKMQEAVVQIAGKPDDLLTVIFAFSEIVYKWENVKDENGKPIKCTEENREKIAARNVSLASQVVRDYYEAVKVQAESEIKN